MKNRETTMLKGTALGNKRFYLKEKRQGGGLPANFCYCAGEVESHTG